MWTELRAHSNDKALNKAFAEAHWPINVAAGSAFRIFRIRQTGHNGDANMRFPDFQLTCGGIELYGILQDRV